MRQLLLLTALFLSFSHLHGQDNCSSAVNLCAGSSTTRSTVGAGTQGTDPALSCGDNTLNNNVWFTVTAISNGMCTVTVNNINNNPGLDMQVYTGTCGALVSTGFCASGSSATGGTMNIIFPISSGTTYYIMVDGNAGNQEAFDIVATTANNAIVARPDANFNTDPSYGCIPLNVALENTATIYGGTNISYEWRIDGGAYLPSSGSDTTILISTTGTHTITQRVCNTQCGCKSTSQDVIGQTLNPTITPNPLNGGCLGAQIDFDGNASIDPSPPSVDPNVTTWDWDFGDPASGVNNSASGQNVSHVFDGPQTTYTVTLTIDGTCGPATVSQVITLLPQPVVSVTGPDSVCEGLPFDLTANVTGDPSLYSYDWVDPSYFACSSCQTSTLTNLSAGGPYTFTVTVTDANGCVNTADKDITVNELPIIFTAGNLTVCPSEAATLNTFTSGGIAPYSYTWLPSAGLDSDTIAAPTTYNTNGTVYCVSVVDVAGCQSNADCVSLNQYPVPQISSSISTLCATASNLQNTFTVTGADPSSTYSWALSPDYPVIVGAAVDSSSIDVDFPYGVATTYTFTAIVTDGATGCTDTITTTFVVTPGITVTVSGPADVCEGVPFDLTANVPGDPTLYSYDWVDPSYFACSTCQTSTLFNLTAGGPYTFTVTVIDTTGCQGTANHDVTIHELPLVTTAGSMTVCPGEAAVLNSFVAGGTAPYNYLWTPSAGLSSDTVAAPTTLNTNGTTYCVTVTDAAGCPSNLDCVSLSQYPLPVITQAVGSMCATSSALQNTFTVNGANPGSSYSWTLSSDYGVIVNAAADSSSIDVDFPFGIAATYNFTSVVTDAVTGCSDTLSTSFTVTAGVTVSITGPVAVCEGLPFDLTANVPGDSTLYSYDWVDPTYFACSSCQTSTVFNLTAGGPYTFTVTVIDTSGCQGTANWDVTINEVPLVFTAGNITVCPSEAATLSTVVSGGTGPYSYLWSPSAGLSSDTSDAPSTFNTDGTSYCVTVTDVSSGCQSTPACVLLDQYTLPVITPSVPVVCASSTNMQNTFTVNGAAPGSGYSWTTSPDYNLITGAAADSSDITVTFPSGIAATYSFISIVTDAITGCIDTVPLSFTVVSGLTMNVTGSTSICSGDSATLSVSGANTYAWTANPSYTFTDSTLDTQILSPSDTTVFTITGAAGTCQQTINFTLNVNPLPYAEAASIAPFCLCTAINLNGSASSSGMNYFWTSAIGSPIVDSSASSTSATACFTDTFFLTVTDPLSGCSSDTFTIANPLPKPNAVATVNPQLICSGQSTIINLDGTGSDTNFGTTYSWVSGNPTFPIVDSAALITDAVVDGPVVFYLTVTDAFGCDSTVSDTVTVQPPPTVSVSSAYLCTTDLVRNSTITISGASPGSFYDWTLIPPCVSPSTSSLDAETFDFSTCVAGNYDFNVTVVDAVTSCLTTLIANVNVVDGVTLSRSADTSYCEGGTALLYVSGANSYLWETTETTDTISVSGLTAAGSPYYFNVTGIIGSCTATDSIRITVFPVPVVSAITGNTTVCANDTSVYYIDPVIGNRTWNISAGMILSGQGTDTVSVFWNGTGVGNLSVNAVNGNNCSGTLQSITVTINPRPDTIPVTGPAAICENSSGNYSINPVAGSTYQWSVMGGTLTSGSSGDSSSVNWGSAGTGIVSVIETSAAGCSGATSNYNVTIRPRPAPPIIAGNLLVCDNIPVQYGIVPNAGSTYQWVTANALSDTLNSTSDTLTVNWGTAGSGQVSIIETNSFGCISDSNIYQVTIILHPDAQLAPDSISICNNTTVQLNGLANTPSVRWYTDGNGTFSDTTISNPVYAASVNDTGFIHLTMVVENIPCDNDTATMVVYHSSAPVITLSSTTTSLCQGDTATITAGGGTGYNWLPGGETTDSILVFPAIATTYVVSTINALGCPAVDSIRINVIPAGIPDAGANQLLCIADTVQLSGSQQNAGGINWTSSGDGTFLPATNDPNAQYVPGILDTTNHTVQLILTTTGACRNLTDTITIDLQGIPTINAGNDTILTAGPGSNAFVYLNPAGTNVNGVIWTSTGSGAFSPSDISFNAVYVPSSADYSMDSILITVTTTGSCQTASDYFTLDFTPFQVPNVFTPYPASPGQNDYFVIPNLPANSTLKVWDRWGMLVFTSVNYQNNWDGFGLESDTYYYVIITTDKSYKGWIALMRD
jgi:gliding motility-associated-like protein